MRQFLYSPLLLMKGDRPILTSVSMLRKLEAAPPSVIATVQREHLRSLLQHAYAQVPYYQRVLDEVGGAKLLAREEPERVLQQLPVLTKAIIRDQWEDLKSRDLAQRAWYENATGGSTGEPVRFVQDASYSAWMRAVKMLFDLWTGYKIGQPKVVLWGSERDLFVGQETLKTRLGRWLRNEHWLNAFRMSEDDMRAYVGVINRVRPVQLLAYAEAVYELARFIEREKLGVHSPKAIMTSAGTLYAHMREVIERVFGAPVFNRYGSREVGDIACECEAHAGLHVSPLTHWVEIIRDDGATADPGEVGEVLVTSLTNRAMPLIRYRIGDMAAWAEDDCHCGRSWPLLKQVTGRVTDVFVRSDQGIVVPEYFIHMLGVVVQAPWIRRFQVVQENYDLIRLLVVPQGPREVIENELNAAMPKLESIVRKVMGAGCKVEVQFVDDIPPSPSGKYRYTISKLRERG